MFDMRPLGIWAMNAEDSSALLRMVIGFLLFLECIVLRTTVPKPWEVFGIHTEGLDSSGAFSRFRGVGLRNCGCTCSAPSCGFGQCRARWWISSVADGLAVSESTQLLYSLGAWRKILQCWLTLMHEKVQKSIPQPTPP